MSVHKIDDYKPYMVVQGIVATHVIPLEVMYKISDREMTIDEVEMWEDIVPQIIKEWLRFLSAR